MTIFDLLFILVILVSVVTLVAAAVSAAKGKRTQSLKILRIYGICAAGYFLTVAAVAFLRPQRVIHVGEPWCFDEWCLMVENVARTPAPPQVSYEVDLRISSQTRRVSQRANGAWVYLIDDHGHRYSPDPTQPTVPLDVLLQPGESVTTSRTFRVPTDVRQLGLITGHGGPYCGPMNILIIGSGGCLFKKPTMIRIQ